jgi:hypothetical protein
MLRIARRGTHRKTLLTGKKMIAWLRLHPSGANELIKRVKNEEFATG